MGIDGEKLTITISRAFYDHLLEKLSHHEESEQRFLEIGTALYTDIVKFEFKLPFIPLPNRSHKKIDWDMLSKRAEQMSFLLEVLNFTEINGEDDRPNLYLSERPQLMSIATTCDMERSFTNCSIEVGFHQSAFDILVKECESDMVVHEAEQRMFEFYSGMSLKTMKEKVLQEKNFRKYGSMYIGICAKVRAGGIPHFIVPGSCACLGANPDDFKDSAELYSHNMDSPLQQLSMLVGVISLWNDFLTPRWQARQRG